MAVSSDKIERVVTAITNKILSLIANHNNDDEAHSTLFNNKSDATHTHGNITSNGQIGTVANKPLITTTNGSVIAGDFGDTSNTFCAGDDERLSDARAPLSHTHLSADITDNGTALSDHLAYIYDNLSDDGISDITTTILKGVKSELSLTVDDCSIDNSNLYESIQIDARGKVNSFTWDNSANDNHYILNGNVNTYAGFKITDAMMNANISVDFKLSQENDTCAFILGVKVGNKSYALEACNKKLSKLFFNVNDKNTKTELLNDCGQFNTDYFTMKIIVEDNDINYTLYNTNNDIITSSFFTMNDDQSDDVSEVNGDQNDESVDTNEPEIREFFFGFLSGNSDNNVFVKNITLREIF